MDTSKQWIAVDLDGTLAQYDKFRGPEHVGEPVAATVERVRAALSAGHQVKIFTARVSRSAVSANSVPLGRILRAIKDWCRQHVGRVLDVTCEKDLHCIEIWDDRAVQFEANTGRPMSAGTRGLIRPDEVVLPDHVVAALVRERDPFQRGAEPAADDPPEDVDDFVPRPWGTSDVDETD